MFVNTVRRGVSSSAYLLPTETRLCILRTYSIVCCRSFLNLCAAPCGYLPSFNIWIIVGICLTLHFASRPLAQSGRRVGNIKRATTQLVTSSESAIHVLSPVPFLPTVSDSAAMTVKVAKGTGTATVKGGGAKAQCFREFSFATCGLKWLWCSIW